MIAPEDLTHILLKKRLELLAYVSTFTSDIELAEEVFHHICAKALWRVDGFESVAQLLACSRQTARQRILELRSTATRRPALLSDKTVGMLECEWARREEETIAEELEALGQCLADCSEIHFEVIERRHLAAETAGELASRRFLTKERAYTGLAQSHQFIEESTRRKLTEAPC
ncbi:MAG: polymerase, sigma-24 subunit, subfamily [Chthoniobacteraceae bacterium]|nr:polymerase, sigma-24 subunit, subfamily [Chthoniobacteraceae bacterium]